MRNIAPGPAIPDTDSCLVTLLFQDHRHVRCDFKPLLLVSQEHLCDISAPGMLDQLLLPGLNSAGLFWCSESFICLELSYWTAFASAASWLGGPGNVASLHHEWERLDRRTVCCWSIPLVLWKETCALKNVIHSFGMHPSLTLPLAQGGCGRGSHEGVELQLEQGGRDGAEEESCVDYRRLNIKAEAFT